jgi:hypothetical protein
MRAGLRLTMHGQGFHSMPTNSKCYWFVSCDTDGCNETSADDQEGSYEAECYARAHGWQEIEPGVWKCPTHREAVQPRPTPDLLRVRLVTDDTTRKGNRQIRVRVAARGHIVRIGGDTAYVSYAEPAVINLTHGLTEEVPPGTEVTISV